MERDVELLVELSTSVPDEVDAIIGDDGKSVDIYSFDPNDQDEDILRAVDILIGSGTNKEVNTEYEDQN